MTQRNNEVNDLDCLPFRGLVNYDIELNFESSKKRIQKLMEDHRLKNFILENKLSQILNSEEQLTCNYHDEESFNKLYLHENEHLNTYYMNIRSLPAHAGELVNFLNMLKNKFQVIVLS